MRKPIAELFPLLAEPRRIFITTHAKPDGDAMGSSLALYHYFSKKGHEPVVVTPTEYGMYLHWLPGNASVVVWPEATEKTQQLLDEADIIFCLDFNALDRINGLGELVSKAKAPKVLIDHHLDPDGFEDYRMWSPHACATAELVFDFIDMQGDKELIDKNIATCIYTGLVTDSGSFRYPAVTPHVHRMTATLMESGMEHWQVHRKIYDSFSENRLRFFGHCLKDKMVVLPEYRAAYFAVSREEMDMFSIKTGDMEGLVNYLLNMDEVIFAALITERDGEVKLSLRSKGDFPANEFAGKYFHGGGHSNAAGGTSYESLEKTVETFTKGLEEYKQLLRTI
ncbi:MAG: DHH family phosphoesterase [Bacteroidota bacterium]|nr:DHH family phosphoesterase [Bacteroidota bacterium]